MTIRCVDYELARCRSCSELEVPYPAQLAAKQARVEQILAAPESVWLPACASSTTAFRNKAKMAIGGSITAPTLGLLDAAGGGVDLGNCPLYPPSMRACFEPLRQFLIAARVAPYDLASRRGEGKFLLLTEAPGSGDLLLRVVLRSREAEGRIAACAPALRKALPALRVLSVNLLPEHVARVEGEHEIVLGPECSVRCCLNGIELRLTPRAFLQTNTAVAQALYQQAQDWLKFVDARQIWDLYCGIGAFALHAAAPGRPVIGQVIGVESVAEAIEAARMSAKEAAMPAEFICADATDWVRSQSVMPDCIIVNPPRRGMGGALCQILAERGPQWVLYSSCNPESLQRDIVAMKHYRIERARLFDMFPHTLHCEVAVLLQRQD